MKNKILKNLNLGLAGLVLAGSLNNLYGQSEKNEENKKTFNFLEKTYIKIKELKNEREPNFLELKEYADIKDEKGKRSYTLKEVLFLNKFGVSVEYAKLINKKNKEGINVLDFYDISEFQYCDKRQSPKDIVKIIDYTDDKGNPIFNKADILTYLAYEVDLKNLVETIDSKKNGDSKEIAKEFYRENVKNRIEKENLDSILNFKDTKKPNALIVYPYSDWNGAFKTLMEYSWRDNSIEKVKEHYDIRFIFAETEKDIYLAIKEMKNIDLLYINGHGERRSISLGDVDKRIFNSKKNEEYSIDGSDRELKEYLNFLNDSARIFLYSCSTGEEKFFNKKNIAKFISESAKNKKVIAYKKPPRHIRVKNYYPFELEHSKYDGEVNYVSGKKEKLK